ncbi:MAG: hypothetical protein Fur0010_16920 [Bdellovibrio sp.]
MIKLIFYGLIFFSFDVHSEEIKPIRLLEANKEEVELYCGELENNLFEIGIYVKKKNRNYLFYVRRAVEKYYCEKLETILDSSQKFKILGDSGFFDYVENQESYFFNLIFSNNGQCVSHFLTPNYCDFDFYYQTFDSNFLKAELDSIIFED